MSQVKTTLVDSLNISCTQESSVLAKGEMSFSSVVEEGPSEKVLECNESKNMDSNMRETLSTCTYFEKSVLAHLLQLIQALPFEVDLSHSRR